MSSTIINANTRMELTCQMKDADVVLEVFDKYRITFRKKFTSIHTGSAATITFVGVRPMERRDFLTNMIIELHTMAQNNDIGNVYLNLSGKIENKKPAPRFGPSSSAPEEHAIE